MGSRPTKLECSVILCVIFSAQFLVILNGVIVAVALPSIQRDLGFSNDQLTWVVSAYLLPFGGFLIVGGRAVDYVGRRQALIGGIAIFTAGSLACGLADTQALLLFGRLIQGLGAAAIMPATLSILITLFENGPKRRRAIAIWGGASSAAGGVALLIGGILTNLSSWTAIFYVNVVLGLAILVTAAIVINMPATATAVKPDSVGALTFTVAAVAIVNALVGSRQYGWTATVTLVSGLIGLILLGIFIAVERVHRTPLIRLSAFKERTLVAANIMMCSVAGTALAGLYLMTLYFQDILTYSPLETGLAFLPITISSLLGSLAAYWFVRLVGLRAAVLGTMLLISLGAAMLSGLNVDHHYDIWFAFLVMYTGAGSGGVLATIMATANVAEDNLGLTSGLINTSQQLGPALWLAIFAPVAASTSAQASDSSTELIYGIRHSFLWIALTAVAIALLLFTILRRAATQPAS